jgi:hypothetical protein
MGECKYVPTEITDKGTVANAAGKCYGVGERWFATHLGPRSPSPGLVTVGAGVCMVVAVHDKESDTGALAHISQTTSAGKSLIMAKEIIMRMIIGVVGIAEPARVQLFFFQGSGLLAGLCHSIANGMLKEYKAGIVDNTGVGYMNYLYLPKQRQIYPVSRTVGDALSGPAPKEIGFDSVLDHIGKEFSVDTTEKVLAYAQM